MTWAPGTQQLHYQKIKKERPEYYLWLRTYRCNTTRPHKWEFTITVDDVKIPSHCPALGIPLSFKDGRGSHSGSPSIDRIDPAKGYVPGNVQVISTKANRMKNNATQEELERFAKWVIETH